MKESQRRKDAGAQFLGVTSAAGMEVYTVQVPLVKVRPHMRCQQLSHQQLCQQF